MQPTAPSPPPLWGKKAPHSTFSCSMNFEKNNFQKKSVRATPENDLEPLIDHPHLPLWGKVALRFAYLSTFYFRKYLLDKNFSLTPK